MKPPKKLAASMFALVLCVSLFALPTGALAADSTSIVNTPQSGTYVFDERGLFTSTEFNNLESQAEALANEYGMGVYFLTTSYMDGLSDPTSSQRTSYATTYYRTNELGLNKKSGETIGDGVMFVVAADSRDYVTIAYGQGSYSFSDEGIDAMEDDVTDYLGDNNWYGGAQAYYRQMASQLSYYERHGEPQVPLDLFDWIFRIVIIVSIPLVITYFVVNGWRKEMRTAVQQSEAGNYVDSSSLNMTKQSDQFVNTTLVATPKPKDNDSDGGGGWGGGGGGGFSSSGGGKF